MHKDMTDNENLLDRTSCSTFLSQPSSSILCTSKNMKNTTNDDVGVYHDDDHFASIDPVDLELFAASLVCDQTTNETLLYTSSSDVPLTTSKDWLPENSDDLCCIHNGHFKCPFCGELLCENDHSHSMHGGNDTGGCSPRLKNELTSFGHLSVSSLRQEILARVNSLLIETAIEHRQHQEVLDDYYYDKLLPRTWSPRSTTSGTSPLREFSDLSSADDDEQISKGETTGTNDDCSRAKASISLLLARGKWQRQSCRLSNATGDITSSISTKGTSNRTTTSKKIGKPTKYDVLFGKGTRSNCHPGNQDYLRVVEQYQKEYRAARSLEEKRHVSSAVVSTIYERGGRFLKLDPRTKQWYVASFESARQKACQALRERPPMGATRSSHFVFMQSQATTTTTTTKRAGYCYYHCPKEAILYDFCI